MQHFNIAIDGPAGAGKSTIAKAVASRLGFIYVDTGAMYRAMALYLLREKIRATDEARIRTACEKARITIRYQEGVQKVILNDEDVSGLIRTEEVGEMASITSGYVPVREKLVELQKQLARDADVIMDGRDIASCVLPDAQVKIYLTASVQVRAARRYQELKARGEDCDLAQIEKDIRERDYRDMHREHSPLIQAPGAVLVDTSDMDIQQVILKIIAIAKEHGLVQAEGEGPDWK